MCIAVALSFGGGAMFAISESIRNAPLSPEGEAVETSETAIPSFVTVSSTTYITGDTTSEGYYRFTVAYSGASQTIKLPAGTYRLQCWGARGGGDTPSTIGDGHTQNATYQSYANAYGNTTWSNQSSRGGAGGYVEGKINLPAETTLNLYVGQAGGYGSGADAYGGWNGGASGSTSSNGGGGGASDIRIGGTTLYYRVIVAGGGGGSDNVHAAGTARLTDDDGSGGAGGGVEGEPAFANGAYIANKATQTGGYAFGNGAVPTVSTDTGGGGGGWYGGYASNNNQGGGGGGSGYVLTSSSARPSGYAHTTSSPYNMTETKSYSGIWNGNGKIVITMYNRPPTNKSAAFGNLSRTGTKTITPGTVADDPDLAISGYGEVLKFVNSKIYTDSACTTEATAYFSHTVTATDTSVTLHPLKYFTNTTFYTKVKDKSGVTVTTSFTAQNTTFSGIVKTTYGLKGSGTGYYGNSNTSANVPDIGVISSTKAWGSSDIYNETTNKLTYLITRPLEPGQTASTRSIWNGLEEATIKVSELAEAVDMYDGSYLDSVFITTVNSTNNGVNYTLSKTGTENKWTEITVRPVLASNGGWFIVPITIGLFENSTGLELTSASSGRLAVDIVFRVGNSRPTLNNASSTPLTVTLNTDSQSGSYSREVSVSELVTDRNDNTVTFYSSGSSLTDVVKVPDKEIYITDKYGAAASVNNYNVGTPSSNVVNDASSSETTGFQQSSIYNSGMANDADVYKEAYVSYSISGNKITFTAIRATRNQYKPTRLNGLGHFYVVVHLTDAGDPRDTGIWVPIALSVRDASDPVINRLSYDLKAEQRNALGVGTASAEYVYISPYFTASFNNYGIGAIDKDNYNDKSQYKAAPLARDNMEFNITLGNNLKDGTPFAFNDFIYIDKNFGQKATTWGDLYKDYLGFSEYVKAERVELYAPTSWFSRLTADQKSLADINVCADDPNISYFYGIKLTALTSTKDKYVDIPLRVTDTLNGRSIHTVISVRVANRTSFVRENDASTPRIETQGGIAALRKDTSGGVTRNVVKYTVYCNANEKFSVTPYDLVYDPDLYTQPTIDNTSPANNNSNPKYNKAKFDTFATNTYKNANSVYMRDNLTDAAVLGKLGCDTLSFVESSLPFTKNASGYAQNMFSNELHLGFVKGGRSADGSGGTIDCLEISPVTRNSGDNVYLFRDVVIADENGSTVQIDIEVRVENALPRLKSLPMFYLSANFNGTLLSSSQPSGGDKFDPSAYNTDFNETSDESSGYNVREFHVRELVTDPDTTDLAKLSVLELPRLGYIDPTTKEFVEEPTYSKYVTVEYNVIGLGQRGSQTVFRLTARSSTQALANGLFVELYVTDGFQSSSNHIRLAFQIEVLNSRPVDVSDSQFTRSENVEDVVRYWDANPVNRTDVVSSRYIAPDAFTADLLTKTGINGLNTVGAKEKAAADKVKYFASDYDEQQRIMPYCKDAALLPKAAQTTGDDVAVTFTNPYGSGEITEENKKGVVSIVWFIEKDGEWYKIDPSDSALSPYGLTLSEALEKDALRWAVRIKPDTNFGEDGLTITVNYRDSSPEGGHTQEFNDNGNSGVRPTPYRGVRNGYESKNKIDTKATLSFNIKIGTLGIVKNLVAYANPNDSTKDNVYFAYYEKKSGTSVVGNIPVYPADADKFTYTPIDLASKNDIARIPISYLAIPNLIADTMGSTVDFETSYYIGKIGVSSDTAAKQNNMLNNMSLFDPATGYTWKGADIVKNPYLTIEYVDKIAVDGDASSEKYVNKNLYYSGTGDTANIVKRNRTTPLREDLFGFTLQKKNIRSKGRLELTIKLAEYTYHSGSPSGLTDAIANKTPKSDTTVKLYVSVPNDNMELLGGLTDENNSASVTLPGIKGAGVLEMSSATLKVPFYRGAQDASVSLVNEASVKNSFSQTARLYAVYDRNDYGKFATPEIQPSDKIYKENAYFLSDSLSSPVTKAAASGSTAEVTFASLSVEQIARILSGSGSTYTYGKNVTDAMLMSYFGVSNSADFTAKKDKILNGNDAEKKAARDSLVAGINRKYTNFFTVSPMARDDASLSFHPILRISLDDKIVFPAYNTAKGTSVSSASSAADKKAAYEWYIANNEQFRGLAVDDANKIYYPFRAIVYDDYLGTGFMDGSYQILEIRVYIDNAPSFVNRAMVTNAGTEASQSFIYNLEIAKNDQYVINISDFFGDNDMLTDSSYQFMTSNELTALSDGSLAANTADAYDEDNTLRLTNTSGNYNDVAIDFNGTYNVLARYREAETNNLVTAGSVHRAESQKGKIRFYAVNRTVNNALVEFTVSFGDSASSRVSVTFKVKVSNQAPATLMFNGQSYVSQLDITMKTGQIFTLLPTTWNKYVSGMYDSAIGMTPDQKSALEADGNAFFDSLYSSSDPAMVALRNRIEAKHKIGQVTDYQNYAKRTERSDDGNNAFHKFKFSAITDAYLNADGGKLAFDARGKQSGSIGFLPLCDDDLPWGLKFGKNAPIGMATNALRSTFVNLTESGNYALGVQIMAVSSCSGVPVNVTVYDAEGKSKQFTFRVTVVNSDPDLKKDKDGDPHLTWDPNNLRYNVALTYGQTVTVNVRDIVDDNDEADKSALTVQRAFNGSAFSIDGNDGSSSNDYISVFNGTQYITITCDNVFLGNKTESIIKFYVVDPTAARPCEVQIKVTTVYAGIADAEETAEFTVKSITDYGSSGYERSVLSLVGGSDSKDRVRDGDFGSRETYNVDMYALYDFADNGEIVPVDKIAATTAPEGKYRLLGYSYSSGKIDINNASEPLSRYQYLQKYFKINFAADGMSALLEPVGATIDFTIPVYFKMTKNVVGVQAGLSVVAGVEVEITVDDSAPVAIKESVTNDNAFLAEADSAVAPSRKFLTVRGCAGYSQQYTIWNKERAELGLFKDLDFADAISFVKAEVVNRTENGVEIPTQSGWEAKDSLKQAYDVTVKDGVLTASIVRKVLNTSDASAAFILPVMITVADILGKTATTILTFEIYNSAPKFTVMPFDSKKGYGVEYDENLGEYVLRASVKTGDKLNINIADFLSDKDIKVGVESYTIHRDALDEKYSLHDIDAAANADFSLVHKIYNDKSPEENLFSVGIADKTNLRLVVTANSFTRGATGYALLALRDSSLALTAVRVRLIFTVANSAAKLREGVNTTITILGGDDFDALVAAEKTISIGDYMLDPNPADNGVTPLPSNSTHLRIYAFVLGEITAGNERIEASYSTNLFSVREAASDNPFNQKLIFTPNTGRYGTQKITISMADDGGVNADGWLQTQLVLHIEIARDPNTITLINHTLPYMNEKVIDIASVVPADYLLGYKLVELRQSSDIDYPEGAIKVRYDEALGKYVIKAERNEMKIKMIATVLVGGVKTDLPFYVDITRNFAPELHKSELGLDIDTYAYEEADLNSDGVVEITPENWLKDPEGDVMRFVRVTSSHNFIFTPTVSADGKTLSLAVAASGTATMTVVVLDATGQEYTYTIKVTNSTLPELNFFIGVVQNVVLNPMLYSGIVLGVILLLLFIIFLAGVRRRRKREQEEVEAMLASEMQLEEQMRRLAAAQSAAYNALPSSAPFNQNMLLSGGFGASVGGAALPPGGASQLPPGSGGDSGFDDSLY